ncbi:MAG TPA: phosphotransferase [Thermoleophilaceae bacterium]|nr:phosphotransferase [Thermoleophilaceae bacterium]
MTTATARGPSLRDPGGRLPLAPDPAVPARDVLLDPVAAEARLRRCLGPAVAGCERTRVTYRVGESLRVLYRVGVGEGSIPVALRTFPSGRSEEVFRRASAAALPTGPLPPVGHDAELRAVTWTFPNDRKLRDLRLLADPGELGRALGLPVAAARLVAYAPETSATAACLDEAGRTVAFAKVHLGDGARRIAGLRAALPDVLRTRAGELRLPRLLAPANQRVLFFEPLGDGAAVQLRGASLGRAMQRLGAALARLHALPAPLPAPRFDRLENGRLHTAAAVIGRVRPELALAAEALAASLAANERHVSARPHVCLHGDPHLGNVLVQRDGVALVDLDHVCGGPPAADLARVLAGLAHLEALGALAAPFEERLRRGLLTGYARSGALPDEATLRWHVAATLLVRHAATSVSRYRPRALRRLAAILARAEELVA